MRKKISFNSGWKFLKKMDPSIDMPQYRDDGWEEITLPHTWNAVDGQDGGNDYWRGIACYVKQFQTPQVPDGGRVFLEVNGAANSAEVSLNGESLKKHEGGFSTFRADLTGALADNGENLLVITVDNSECDTIYPQKADFTFYGGIYRDVNLLITDQFHFELEKDGTSGLKVTPDVSLKDGSARITLEAWCNKDGRIRFEIDEDSRTIEAEVSSKRPVENRYAKAEIEAEAKEGYAKAEVLLENVHLWDGLADPYLYSARAVLIEDGEEKDEVSVRFGCRTFSMDPDKGFFLNGRSYPLRGVSRHQDRGGAGNAITLDMMKEDMEVVRELGANTLRLAHYQHAQEFYDLCDEEGIIVWAEIPMITSFMPNAQGNAKSQMRELITQSYHHPSIVCWGLSNEITAASAVDEELIRAHQELNDLAHAMDSTRPTSMAHVFTLEKESPLIQVADIGSYNLYFGWYLGSLKQNEEFFDEYHAMYPDRVMGFSEYGADANPDFHNASPEQGDYSEEYQCRYHEYMIDMIDKRPYLWATHVWNLFDFAADGRNEGGRAGVNQKGLVQIDHRTKKDAFYLYKAAWSKEPFVHLCGKRYVDREMEETEIKVYSNQNQVTLYVDGEEVGTQEGRRVFTFQVPISGEHQVKAVSGEWSDAMVIRKVDQPNPAYRLAGTGEVVNWFDNEEFKENCYSIKDTMGDLQKNPKTAMILGKLMEKASASRGDVAKSASGGAALQKMMAKMSLEQLLKQAGPSVASKEDIQQLNRTLQNIRKDV